MKIYKKKHHKKHCTLNSVFVKIAFLLMAFSELSFAQSNPTVTGFSPTTNLRNAPRNSNIVHNYNVAVTSTATSQNNFFIHRSKKGRIGTAHGTYSGANTSTITYNPTNDFFPGELISVSRTTGVQDTDGNNSSYSQDYSFYAEAGVGPARFNPYLSSNTLNAAAIATYAADINNDNNLDLLTLTASQITIMTGNGDGTLNAGATIVLPLTSASCWAIADFDRDGDLDIAVGYNSGFTSSIRISIYRNGGNGTFGSPYNRYASNLMATATDTVGVIGVTALAATDYNNSNNSIYADGDIDLIIGFRRNNNTGKVCVAQSTVLVFGMNTIYTLNAGPTIYTISNNSSTARKIVTGFFGNIASGPFFTRSSVAILTSNNQIVMLPGYSGQFSSHTYTAPNGATALDMVTGDFDADGRLDFAYASLGNLFCFLNTSDNSGNITFSSTATSTSYTGGFRDIEIGDIDGDGDLDLVLVPNGNSNIEVYKNNGSGTFAYDNTNPIPNGYYAYGIAAGDFDGDNDIDLASVKRTTNNNMASILLNEVFINSSFAGTVFCAGSSLNVNYTSNGVFYTNYFTAQLSDASGSFASPTTIGLLVSTASSGTISCTIPLGTATGSGYKIRVISSNPSVIGTESNSFTINSSPEITLASRNCNTGNATAITVSGANSYTWSPASGLNTITGASVIASPVAPTTYTVTGTSSNGCTSSRTISVSDQCYCTGTYSVDCSSNDYLDDFYMMSGNFMLIQKTNSGCNGHLGNYTAYSTADTLSTTLYGGENYDIYGSFGPYNQGIGIWIDLNRDGDFDDANEFVFSAPGSSTFGGNFTLPDVLTEGVSVMRVRTIFNNTPTAGDACSAQTYGEIEDFKVTLISPLTVVSTNPVENSTNVPVAQNTSVTFSPSVVLSSLSNTRFHGSLKGRHFGLGSVSQPTYTFNPNINYKPGEKISVTIPSASSISGGTLSSPYQFEYFAAAGSGTARFQALSSIASNNISDIVAGDFNNDGDIDFAVTRASNDEFAITVQTYNNNGSGTFTSGSSFFMYNDVGIAAGDLDNDGDLDLVTAVPYASNVMDFYTNNGSGVFTQSSSSWTTEAAANIKVADMDGDGNLDIVCSNPTTGRLFYYRNTGTGALASRFDSTPVLIQSLSGINSFTIGDFNKDGLLDVAHGRTVSGGVLRINYNTPSNPGSFQAATVLLSNTGTSTECTALNCFDYDGDGDLDLVATKTADGTMIVVRNNYPSSTYTLEQTLTVNASPRQIEAADFDGDGDIDLYVAHSSAAAVYVANNSGTFAVTTHATGGTNPAVICSADFDGDGDIDIVGKSIAGFTPTPVYFIENGEYTVTATVNNAPVCAGYLVNVTSTLSPPVWPSTTFTAELSDASGSFASPVTLGNVVSTTGVTSNFAIPYNTPTGTGYRIRWSNTLTGSTIIQSAPFTINSIPVAPTLSVIDNCGNSTITASGYSGTLSWSDGGSGNPRTVGPGNYYVMQIVNGCSSTVSNYVTANPLPVPSAPSLAVINNCGNSTITASGYSGSLNWSDGGSG
ncbi:MAG: VCBS repeat-containing protein, partial [Bacteroidia bacterium]|nr:VCBS repeat-containing protein [Bacteroidia bacterium]